MERLRYNMLPEAFQGGIQRYIVDRIEPGSFLCAVLCNDLFDAIARADDEALASLPAIVAWIYNEAPANSHGSRECVTEWLKGGG